MILLCSHLTDRRHDGETWRSTVSKISLREYGKIEARKDFKYTLLSLCWGSLRVIVFGAFRWFDFGELYVYETSQ